MTGAYDKELVWIIGASSGIGEALAHELDAQGATLVLSARREENLQALNHALSGKHHVVPLDVVDFSRVSGIAQELASSASLYSAVRVVFMAAIYAPHDNVPKSPEFIKQMIEVNVTGAMYLVEALRPHFPAIPGLQIALCASVAGYRGLPTGQPYCATKAALINYAESLHVELKPAGVDVRVINPGFVRSPLTDKNNFPMPMIMEVDDAAKALARGLRGRSFEIHFPKKFTYLMKVVKLLPNWLYLRLSKKLVDN